jgi:hypothetical protein
MRVGHAHGADAAVGAGQEHHRLVARGGRRREDDRAASAAGRGHQRQDRQRAGHAAYRAPGKAPTTNSVPRTPRIIEGVRTFIASGDCLASLPDTAESVPRRSELSKRPT